MDALFLLSPRARLYFLQKESQTLGCAYICLWYYLPHPSNCLISIDGCYNEDDRQPSCSSGSYKKKLFEDYKGSFCSVENGCVPGLAFKQGLPYIQLEDSDLINSASTLAQLEFYKEAGIKKSLFIGCNCGEIELGSLTSNAVNMQMLFNNDFINFQRSQTQPGDLLLHQNIHSSSSTSSLKSLSVGSPEYTSLILSNPVADKSRSDQAFKQGKSLTSHHQITKHSDNLYRNLLLPSSQTDDAALTRAMLVVISSSNTYLPQQEESRMLQTSSAFEPFGSISTSFESIFRLEGQRMIKKSISFLRKIYSFKFTEARRHEKLPVSSSKLHHVIAERKRRVKINESLRDLRMLLPPGPKKDYATVLSKTKDYVRALKAQINELDERNRKLEMQLKSSKQAVQATNSNERVEVQVMRASESEQINILIIVRDEVNMMELLLKVLECLKGKGIMNLTTIDASSNHTMASLTLQVQASDWDEDSLKQVLTMAILDADRDVH